MSVLLGLLLNPKHGRLYRHTSNDIQSVSKSFAAGLLTEPAGSFCPHFQKTRLLP